MIQSTRAVYQNGQLRLLEPVELSEGQEVELTIHSTHKDLRAALGDLIVTMPNLPDQHLDEAALLQEIEDGFRGLPPLSQVIIDERDSSR